MNNEFLCRRNFRVAIKVAGDAPSAVPATEGQKDSSKQIGEAGQDPKVNGHGTSVTGDADGGRGANAGPVETNGHGHLEGTFYQLMERLDMG